jgi:hypothetical protein
MLEMFDFNEIEANKRGEKSEKQVKLIKEAVNPLTWLVGGLIILFMGGCFYLVLSTLGGGSLMDLFGGILGLVGFFAFLRGLTTWNLRRKLLAEPIQAEDGVVKFVTPSPMAQLLEADHYSAETFDGRKLHLIGLAGVDPKLPPGDYRFYFMKTRSWFLQAEPLFSAEEMRSDLNDLLATAFEYDAAYLENCRQEARAGQLQTVEGLPKLDLHETSVVGEDELASVEYYCTLGDLKFRIPSRVHALIFEALPHRAYFRSGTPDQLVAIEVM